MIRALLVDDEDIARERLRQLLSSIADLEVIGEAADGEEAIQKTVELQPDLLLLDIQMPGVSGLEVAACLPRPRPKIVFCTAFDTYAVKAFELHAVDYLLKPVSLHRLAQAIERIRRRAPNDADDDVEHVTRKILVALKRWIFLQDFLQDGTPETPGTDAAVEVLQNFIILRRGQIGAEEAADEG